MTSNFDFCKAMIKRHEAGPAMKPLLSAIPDTGGWQIGYGHFSEEKPEDVAPEEAERLFEIDFARAKNECLNLFGEFPLDDVRRDALIDMLYNLGVVRFSKFKKMIEAIRAGDWRRAALEACNSQWARETGFRAVEIVLMLAIGERPDFFLSPEKDS